MNKKMNRLIAFLMVAILTVTTLGFAVAEKEPRADLIFNTATVNLKSTKKVTYMAGTYDPQGVISITACWLQKKVDDQWSYVCALPLPAASYNTFGYAKEMNYSSYIGSGTFRVGATFNADGHRITRYSNTRSF